MEKFASKGRPCFGPIITLIIFMSAGCASVQMPGYVSRVDHPYDRKFYASFEKVTSTCLFVLKHQGWAITDEVDPAVYERDDRYDNNSYQNLLIITDIRKHAYHLTGVRLNVFLHSIGNTCEVQIRFSSGRNDRLAQGLLDAVENEVNR